MTAFAHICRPERNLTEPGQLEEKVITEHHTSEIAGTQIGVPICFTEYPQLSSLAAELWTVAPC